MNYFNLADCLNYDCVFNFNLGNRSTGKSFAHKKRAIDVYSKTKGKFVYIRRTQKNLDEFAPTFFHDISEKYPASWDMMYKNGKFLMTFDKNVKEPEYEVCGYAFSVAGLHNVKSAVLRNVKTILFDEFIPDDLRYSHPADIFYEPRALVGIYMTVARDYGKVIDNEVRVYCVSNFVSMFNPYFTYFGVDLTGRTRYVDKERSIYARLDFNTAVAEEIRNSKAGAFISSTDYGAYALENKALKDSERHVLDKVGNPMPLFSVWCNGDWYTVCSDNTPRIIVRAMFDPSLPRRYRLGSGGDESIPWMDKQTIDWLKRAYRGDVVYYDKQRTKNMFGGPFEIWVDKPLRT